MTRDYTDVLGKIFLHWIAQLHDKVSFLAETRNRKVLYCARAGKRIDDLMTAYTSGNTTFQSDLFGISRIAACKVAAADALNFDIAHAVTAETLQHVTLADVCRAYLQHDWDISRHEIAALSRLDQPFTKSSFRSLIASNDAAAAYFRKNLAASKQGLQSYLQNSLSNEVTGSPFSGFILIDSGWKGSIQKVLTDVFPEYGWESFYFGVIDSQIIPDRTGILFNADRYVPSNPASVFLEHRHLIETILEPNAPSVEEVLGGPLDSIARNQLDAVRAEIATQQTDHVFLSILSYVKDNAQKPLDEIIIDFNEALPKLVPMILHPTREDAIALAGKDRSIDFGREGSVPVLTEPLETDQAEHRIQFALWKQGQIALEYERPVAKERQRIVLSLETENNFFAGHESNNRSTRAGLFADGKPQSWTDSVAIVTRTKNRPLLFKRAAISVACQT